MEAELTKLADILLGMVTLDIVYMTIGTWFLTQTVKVLAQLKWENVPTPILIYVISPAVGEVIARPTWSNTDVPWWVAGVVAAAIASFGHWLFVAKFLGTVAPTAQSLINVSHTAGILNK